MAVTKIKPTSSGSYTAAALDAAGRVTTADTTVSGLSFAGNQLQAMASVNEFNNCAGAIAG